MEKTFNLAGIEKMILHKKQNHFLGFFKRISRHIYFISLLTLTTFSIGCKENIENKGSISKERSGKEIYQITCKLCHGSNGDLGLNNASDLSKSILNLNERILVIKKGRKTMQSYEKVLSEDEIKKVAIYLESLISQ